MACDILEALVQYMYDYEGEIARWNAWVDHRCSGIDRKT